MPGETASPRGVTQASDLTTVGDRGDRTEEGPQTRRFCLLVRHGEGLHNATSDWDLRDPRLNELGIQQATRLGCRLVNEWLSPGNTAPLMVVVSPLRRAIETAALAMPFLARQDHPLPPSCRVVLTAMHSERWSAACDEGSSPADLLKDFPFIEHWEGFAQLPDAWWPVKGTDRDWRARRVPAMCEWIRSQQAVKQMVVVGHGAFFREMTGRHLDNGEFLD
jgi:broad specificity phosphatase PhoE